jgi:hypothetical protein
MGFVMLACNREPFSSRSTASDGLSLNFEAGLFHAMTVFERGGFSSELPHFSQKVKSRSLIFVSKRFAAYNAESSNFWR